MKSITSESNDLLKIHENSFVEINRDPKLLKQFEIQKGDRTSFIYKNEGVTFIDAQDYDAKYLESLVFYVPDSVTKFIKTDEELSDIDCIYSWTVISKIPEKVTLPVRSGVISGTKNQDGTWNIKVNVDTQHKFGGYLERQSSRKINYTES